jgi:N-methylhydantoinase A/oxoprolinase/acetone carboxylase beta subunit
MSEAIRIVPKEITLTQDDAAAIRGNVEQLGAYLIQMAQMIQRMQQRMDEMEAQQKKVTLSHRDVKDILQLIRIQGADYCMRYNLLDDGSAKAVRAGMKKAVLNRYGVKDLHDVPAIARQAVEALISRWADIKLVYRIREKHRAGGD